MKEVYQMVYETIHVICLKILQKFKELQLIVSIGSSIAHGNLVVDLVHAVVI
jgi:hypothetical protein